MYRRAGQIVLVVVMWAGLATLGRGQTPPTTGAGPPTFDDPLNALPQLPGASGGDVFGSRVEFSGSFRIEQGTRNGRLSIEARIQSGWHIYSTTQPSGGPRPTVIDIAASTDVQVTGGFVADRDATVHEDPAFPGIPMEEFDTQVTWSAPIRLAENMEPERLNIQVTVNGQVCQTGGSCDLISDVPVTASFAGYFAPPRAAGEFRGEDGHITIVGHVEPKVAAPGGTIHLVITAKLAPTWHVYGWAETDPKKISKPTLIVLRKTSGWRYGKPKASVEPKAEESGLKEEPVLYYHEDAVTWTVPMQVPEGRAGGRIRPGRRDRLPDVYTHGCVICRPASTSR